jgi:uncharacterized protein (TIGR04255 family)
MSSYPKLSKPPIAEAVIEFQVRVPENIDISKFKAFQDKLSDRFPYSSEIRFIQAQVQIHPSSENTKTIGDTIIGLRLESADRRTVVQSTIRALGVSQLAPYDSWETLRARAEELWPVYCDIVGPMAVTRLGVRYINRIVVSGDGDELVDFDKILTAGPRIPSRMPQELTEFFQRVVIPLPNERATLVITQALEAPQMLGAPGQVVVLLDVDAFSDEPHDDVNSVEVWETLERLRQSKNMAFFSSITPQALERMK